MFYYSTKRATGVSWLYTGQNLYLELYFFFFFTIRLYRHLMKLWIWSCIRPFSWFIFGPLYIYISSFIYILYKSFYRHPTYSLPSRIIFLQSFTIYPIISFLHLPRPHPSVFSKAVFVVSYRRWFTRQYIFIFSLSIFHTVYILHIYVRSNLKYIYSIHVLFL